LDEVENQTVVLENAAPEASPKEVISESTEVSKEPVQVQEEDVQERNFKALRQGKKEAERRALELEQQLKMQQELMTHLVGQRTQLPPQEEDELESIPDDDYLPKGKVKKLIQRAEQKAEKLAQQAVEKALEEREKAQYLPKLKAKFSDFEEVVTPETLELLEQQDPELANTILELKDPYKMGFQSYKYIKSMGLADKVPGARRAKEVEKKLEQNAKTVQSPQAFDKRPMAQTFQLTEANKQALWKEMNQYGSLAGSVPNL